MMAGAIGQLHYEPAVPTLIGLLPHEYEQIRRTAAWSLGELRAVDAEPALRSALEHETDKYAAQRMREALGTIGEMPARRGNSCNPQPATAGRVG